MARIDKMGNPHGSHALAMAVREWWFLQSLSTRRPDKLRSTSILIPRVKSYLQYLCACAHCHLSIPV